MDKYNRHEWHPICGAIYGGETELTKINCNKLGLCISCDKIIQDKDSYILYIANMYVGELRKDTHVVPKELIEGKGGRLSW